MCYQKLLFLSSRGCKRRFSSSHKIPWVSWSDVCKSKQEGGLGIKDLSLFNWALVWKWVGRLLDEKYRLWPRVIFSKYGSLEGSLSLVRNGRRGHKVSVWRKDLCRMYWGVNGNGLRGSFYKKLGRGEGTSFWSDLWVGDTCLMEEFPRLFRLSCQKGSSVSEMGCWVDGQWRWALRWSRVIFARNNELLENLLSLIGMLSPSHAGEDRWHWKHSSSGIYEVSAAYNFLLKQQAAPSVLSREISLAFRRLWKGWAIRKANITT